MGRKKLERIVKEIRVRIQPSLYEKLIQRCECEYKNMSELIREIIQKYLNEQNYEKINNRRS